MFTVRVRLLIAIIYFKMWIQISMTSIQTIIQIFYTLSQTKLVETELWDNTGKNLNLRQNRYFTFLNNKPYMSN